MSEEYFVLRLSGVTQAAGEWLSEAVFEWGALGMSEVLNFTQPEGEEDVFTQIPGERQIDVYFATAPDPRFMDEMGSRFPRVSCAVTAEANRDWLAEWKKGFKPFELSHGHWVVPSWCQPPPQALHKILIDPGMAFGTGTHETTRLVAEFLTEKAQDAKFNSLLDVGTGTGILAILACQQNIKTVHATEIEVDSRRVANENFALNGYLQIRLDDRQVEQLSEQYDVVLANIIDGVLVRIQDALKQRVKPGGWLILSGIIKEREQDFLAGFQLPPAKVWVRRELGDWLLYAVRL